MFKNKAIKKIKVIFCLITIFFIFAFAFIKPFFHDYNSKEIIISINETNKSRNSRHKSNSRIHFDTQVIDFPNNIPFTIQSLKTIIPTTIRDDSDWKIFKDVATNLINLDSWNDLKETDVSNSLLKLFTWYSKELIFTHSKTPFPYNERDKFTNATELRKLFYKINKIPKSNSVDEFSDKWLKYNFPTIDNIINENFVKPGSSERKKDLPPQINQFEHKMISIDVASLPQDTSFAEFKYYYKVNDNSFNKIYRIFFSNKNGGLSDQSKTIENLINEGNIIIREDGKIFDPSNPSKINISNQNIHFARNDFGKIEVYTSLKNKVDSSYLSFNNIPENWKKAINIGFLDSSITPKNIQKLLENEDFSIIENATRTHLFAYSVAADWKSNDAKQENELTFYIAPNQQIIVPFIYNGHDAATASFGTSNIVFKTDENGIISTDTTVLKIPQDIFIENIKPIQMNYRIENDVHGLKWTEVKLQVDKRIILGSKNLTSNPFSPTPDSFQLEKFSALGEFIIFEKPILFKGAFKKVKINYEKEIDKKKELEKFIGDVYYSAWNIYPIPKYDITEALEDFSINNIIHASYDGNKLTEFSPVAKIFAKTDKPTPTWPNLVSNNFGFLLATINKYSNSLNKIIKDLTGKNLFETEWDNHFKPSKNIQESKFAEERILFLAKNKNSLTKQFELQVALDIFVNGQSVLKNYEESEIKAFKVDLLKLKPKSKTNLVKFAMPRIIDLLQERFKSIYGQFKEKIDNYKYEKIIENLLDADRNNVGDVFKGLDSKTVKLSKKDILGTTQDVKILPPLSNQTTLKRGVKKFKNFIEQLKSIVGILKTSPQVINILGASRATKFQTDIDFLFLPKNEREQKLESIIETSASLFKVVDTLANEKKLNQNNLMNLLGINKTIKDNNIRRKRMVDSFNEAVERMNESRKTHVSSLSFKTNINEIYVSVASHNMQKIFDSWSKTPNITDSQKSILKKFSIYNYVGDPNKLSEFAIKINDYNLDKFFEDLAGSNIERIAKEISKMDIEREIPNRLPEESRVMDFFKGVADRPNILFGVSGSLFMVIGLFVLGIGLTKKIDNKKSLIFTGIFFLGIGLVIAITVTLFPAIGVMSLLFA